jgi:hypothetical protein
LVLAALAAVLLLQLSAPARAESASSQWVNIAPTLCTYGSAQLSTISVSGVPAMLNATTTVSAYRSCPGAPAGIEFAPCSSFYFPLLGSGCPLGIWSPKTMPAGQLLIRQDLYYKGPNGGDAAFCRRIQDLHYSSVSEASMTVVSTVGYAPSGPGTYSLTSYVAAWDGSPWADLWFSTGSVYVF